jgi:hypothetical protein
VLAIHNEGEKQWNERAEIWHQSNEEMRERGSRKEVKKPWCSTKVFSSPYIFLPIFAAIYCGVPRGHLYINVCICANAISIVFSVLLSRTTHPFLDVVLFYVVNFVLGAVESFDKFCRGIGSFREQSRIRIVLFFIFVNRKNRLSPNFHAYTH